MRIFGAIRSVARLLVIAIGICRKMVLHWGGCSVGGGVLDDNIIAALGKGLRREKAS